MNAKEECLKLYRHEKSSIIPFPLRHMNLLVLHELERGCGRRDPEGIYEDCFGVKWFLHSTGAIPVQKEHRLADITRFREEGVIPTDAQVDSFPWDDWISAAVQNPRWDTENNYTRIIVPSGFFERLHHLMGMEEALIALIEEPEAVAEFNRELLRYKKRVVDNVCKRISVDVMTFLDDFGNSKNMFMPPELWRELYYSPIKELVEYVHKKGAFYEQHSDGYITPIVGDFVAAGVDATHPLEGINDIEMIAREYGGKLLIFGGAHSIRLPNATEAEAQEIIHNACRLLAPTCCWVPDWDPPDTTQEQQALFRKLYTEKLAEMGYICE